SRVITLQFPSCRRKSFCWASLSINRRLVVQFYSIQYSNFNKSFQELQEIFPCDFLGLPTPGCGALP
ncbi:unnamed protein product, partial [Linum tenue]